MLGGSKIFSRSSCTSLHSIGEITITDDHPKMLSAMLENLVERVRKEREAKRSGASNFCYIYTLLILTCIQIVIRGVAYGPDVVAAG